MQHSSFTSPPAPEILRPLRRSARTHASSNFEPRASASGAAVPVNTANNSSHTRVSSPTWTQSSAMLLRRVQFCAVPPLNIRNTHDSPVHFSQNAHNQQCSACLPVSFPLSVPHRRSPAGTPPGAPSAAVPGCHCDWRTPPAANAGRQPAAALRHLVARRWSATAAAARPAALRPHRQPQLARPLVERALSAGESEACCSPMLPCHQHVRGL